MCIRDSGKPCRRYSINSFRAVKKIKEPTIGRSISNLMPCHTYIVIFCYMNIFRFYKWRFCSPVRTLIKFFCLNITDNSVFRYNLRKSSAYSLVSIYAYNLVSRWNFSKNLTLNAVLKPNNSFLLYCCRKLINSPFLLNNNSVRKLKCLISCLLYTSRCV